MMTSALSGATLFPLQSFSRRGALDLICGKRLTVFGGVPPMFNLLARTSVSENMGISSLRIVFSSSARLAIQDNQMFHKRYGIYVRQLYGSTETGSICYNDHPELERYLGSVGRPLSSVRVTVHGDEGQDLPNGVEGEIVVSSPFAISSYDRNQDATRSSFKDGEYLTGDLGYLDIQGYLTLTGRTRLVINRGGYKVNPQEVEDTIRLHPKVVDAAVIGAPTRQGDEVVRCVVVVEEPCTPEEIIQHCRGLIASYKIPSRVEFTDRLPKTSTGKIRWKAL